MSKSNVLPFALLAGAGLWFLAVRQARAGTSQGIATSTNPPAAGRAFFASPAVASGVQAGQSVASALGTLVNRALGSTGSSSSSGSSMPATTTGDFARLDRATTSNDGLSFNPPNNSDPYATDYQMPADLADFWG